MTVKVIFDACAKQRIAWHTFIIKNQINYDLIRKLIASWKIIINIDCARYWVTLKRKKSDGANYSILNRNK